MKKKSLATRLLSVLLSAAVIATSSNAGALLMDVQAGNVSDNSAPVSESGETEKKETPDETDKKETVTDDSGELEADKKEMVTDDSGELEADKKETDENLKANTLIPDENLRSALRGIYNAQKGSNITDDEFTLGHLKSITGEVDLSGVEIGNVAGIGYVENATKINLANTGITEIPANEFANNGILQTIIIPNEIKSIGDSAFSKCTSLQNIWIEKENAVTEVNSLPENLEDLYVGDNIFNGCTALESFTFPQLDNPASLQSADAMFQGCTNLNSVTVSKQVQVLPINAFYGAGNEENGMTVKFEEGSLLATIQNGAFQYANMSKIDLSPCKNLTSIGERAFSSCNTNSDVDNAALSKIKLEEVIMPAEINGTMEIGTGAFLRSPIRSMGYKEGTEGVVIPDYVKTLGKAAFYGNGAMTKLTLGAELTAIESFTFEQCTKLATVEQSVDAKGNCQIQSIGDCAFRNTTSLMSADFLSKMNHLTVIGNQNLTETKGKVEKEWGYNTTTKNPNWETSGKKYGSDVFYGSGIASAELPGSLRTINSRAFYKAASLKKVTWYNDKTLAQNQAFVINTEAFSQCGSLETFVYPDTKEHSASFVIADRAFTVDEEGSNSALKVFSPQGVSNADGEKNSLPVTLTKLGKEAFFRCADLPSMAITNNESGAAPELGERAFRECFALATAELPAALTKVPNEFFYDSSLGEFPKINGESEIVEIGNGAFFGSKIVSLDIHDLKKLQSLGDYAFAYENTKDGDGRTKSDEYLAYEEIAAMDNVSDQLAAYGQLSALEQVILPDSAGGNGPMKWGNGLFFGAFKLDTLSTGNVADTNSYNNCIYIPSYVADTSCGSNLFSGTAVTNAVWGYAVEKKGYSWSRIPNGMFNATGVAKLSDACIPATDLVSIGEVAYSGCPYLTEVDLSVYSNLKETGRATFANCFNLETVKLPDNPTYLKTADDMFHVGYFEGVIDKDITYYSRLKEVDFGSVQELGAYSFATCDTKKSQYDTNKDQNTVRAWSSAITEIDFTETNIQIVGEGAFKGNLGLEKIIFTGKNKNSAVKEIRKNAFESCKKLNMTETPMSDGISVIGGKAFYRCSSLGKVTFGSGLTQIGEQAFAETAVIEKMTVADSKVIEVMRADGLREVDFKKCTQLMTIGKNAFYRSALTKFDITNTVVKILNTYTLSECPYLLEVSLNESMQQIVADSMSGCYALNTVTFFATTVADSKAFYTKGTIVTEKQGEAARTKVPDDKEYCTPVDAFHINVKPVSLIVGIGTPTKFPYYVNKYVNNSSDGKISTMIIGSETSKENDLEKYVKVYGGVGSKFYRNVADEDHLITDKQHFEEVGNEKLRQKVHAGTVEVMTFELEGLQPTPEGQTIPFRVSNELKFTTPQATMSKPITTQYELKVMDVPYYAVLYSDRERKTLMPDVVMNGNTGMGTGRTNICLNSKNTSGIITCYYDILTDIQTSSVPETGDLIIESSNPDVIAAGGQARLVQGSTSQWKLAATAFSANASTLNAVTNGKSFQLIPKSCGDATVTIYPADSPNKKITWSINVKTDINSIGLTVPTEYSKGFQPGDTFNVLDTIGFYMRSVSLSQKAGNLATLPRYSNGRITYTSSDPQVASVDANGNVTIKAVTTENKPVKINATSINSDGKEVKARELTINVKYPAVARGTETAVTTGGTVKITALPGKDTPGTATYTKLQDGATNVTIPSTITVNGVVCNVTQIAAGAFKDNKNVKSITIGSNITKIDKELFKGCSNLQTVTIQGNITEIGESAFEGCASLKEVSIPKTTTKIGKRAFYNCKKMTKVTLSSSAKVTEIGESAFEGCSSLTAVSIPNTTTKIGKRAFYNCKKMTKVTLSSSAKVTEIGESAFQNCTALKSVTIPYAVKNIGKKAFYNCIKLSKVTINNTKSKLTRIGESAFQKCTVLTKITIPKKVTAIDKKAFYGCKKLKTVTISSSAALLTIGESAFSSCAVLAKITIPKKVTAIGSKAFYSCKKLKTITVMSASLRSVGANAFKGIYKSATIKVPKAKKDAYKNLFRGKGQSSKVKIK